jgi:hypothetical protein
MKAGIAVLAGITLPLITILAFPCLAQSSPYSSTTTSTALSNNNTSASDQSGTTTTTTTTPTTTENDGSSWEQSVSDAANQAKIAVVKTYNDVARDVSDISLEGRILAVLHEDKSTRDLDVHVMADNGVVTVTGVVPSERNAERVEEVVANVYGVKAVSNDLNYPRSRESIAPHDSTAKAHPAYSDTAPGENAPVR